MKIIVLNGSPKGEYSITLQYAKFLQKVYAEFDFQVLHVSQMINKLEKNEEYFNEMEEEVKTADMILWIFGLWVLAVPVQYMRFIGLITERNAESAFRDKYTHVNGT